MKIVLSLFLLTTFLFSKALVLDNLLKEYEDSEALYKKTKKDSAGFLLVYSREDLEAMQAYSLRDVMKTVRMYTMQIENSGILKVVKVSTSKISMPSIKLYIDDFEVTTVLQSNALDMYGDMDLYFVDHIEIYQGGSSIAFGNEPGAMVIRLYSKEPSRENSRSVQFSIDNRSGGNLRAVDAGTMGEYEYLLYGDAAKTDFDTYTRNGQELSRDSKRYQAHFKISKKDDFQVDLDAIYNKIDIFNGLGQAPTGDDTTRAYSYINVTKFFQDNLKISLSASIENKRFKNEDLIGMRFANGTMGNSFEAKVNSNTYKATIEKKIIKGKHDLLLGFQFQKNVIDLEKYDVDNFNQIHGPDKLDVYMFYLEELYSLDESNLFALSAKADYYNDNASNDSLEYSVRLGYISIFNEQWKTKLFLIRRYIYPNMLQSTLTPPIFYANPDLDSTEIKMATGELEYNDNTNRAVFGYAYKIIDDALTLNQNRTKYINKSSTTYFNRIYVRGEHKFDLENKLVLEFYKGYADKTASPAAGGLVQLFNKIGKFNIYNELVYRESYHLNTPTTHHIKMDAGYDYTLSVSYPISRNITLKAKGENLLDSASETLIDDKGDIKVPAIERRAMLTMEYTF
jgi:iron complex outermembrane receptor protein